jgi:hypothetical protein
LSPGERQQAEKNEARNEVLVNLPASIAAGNEEGRQLALQVGTRRAARRILVVQRTLRMERCFAVHITKLGLGNEKHFKLGLGNEELGWRLAASIGDAQTPKTTLNERREGVRRLTA